MFFLFARGKRGRFRYLLNSYLLDYNFWTWLTKNLLWGRSCLLCSQTFFLFIWVKWKPLVIFKQKTANTLYYLIRNIICLLENLLASGPPSKYSRPVEMKCDVIRNQPTSHQCCNTHWEILNRKFLLFYLGNVIFL